ncbi:MAG: hypothetical protein ISS48_02680 [Candidatus Aenigmarchaeota archaeon]|nr:hypothetical protein [Candidatus Aenigmarchaeota archaeon]
MLGDNAPKTTVEGLHNVMSHEHAVIVTVELLVLLSKIAFTDELNTAPTLYAELIAPDALTVHDMLHSCWLCF